MDCVNRAVQEEHGDASIAGGNEIECAEGQVSIYKRLLSALVGNGARSALNFIAGVLVMRALGPSQFGEFAFIIASYTALRPLLDLGSSSAFFTFIASEPNKREYIAAYQIILFVQVVIIVTFVVFVPSMVRERLWLGIPTSTILLGWLACFAQLHLWACVGQIGEAHRQTLLVQMLSVSIAVLYLSGIVIIQWWTGLSVTLLLAFLLAQYLLGSVVGALVLQRAEKKRRSKHTIEPEELRSVWGKYFVYCRPLVLATGVGAVCDFADRWLLQWTGGAPAQALYQASFQFSAITLFATASILQIFWREAAEAAAKIDFLRLQALYENFSKAVVVIGAAFAGLLLPWAPDIVAVVLGVEYIKSVPIFMCLLLYPVHQALGQVAGTLAYAIKETRTYAIFAVFGSLISVLVSYVMQAPSTALVPGLGLGAMGLAVKMVMVNVVSVNLLCLILSRKVPIRHEFGYQIGALLSSVLVGFSAKSGAGLVYGTPPETVAQLIKQLSLAGVCFVLMFGALVASWPAVCGIDAKRMCVLRKHAQRHASDCARLVAGSIARLKIR